MEIYEERNRVRARALREGSTLFNCDPVALVTEDGKRVPLSAPDAEGFQTPEWANFTAVAVIVRFSGGLYKLPLRFEALRDGDTLSGLDRLTISTR